MNPGPGNPYFAPFSKGTPYFLETDFLNIVSWLNHFKVFDEIKTNDYIFKCPMLIYLRNNFGMQRHFHHLGALHLKKIRENRRYHAKTTIL
jgi:hypothetical protein